MAFHFNWSPLIADTDRVRHMLTSALNRSPKPPIIVDNIIVNELNLGSTPPSLEILEIGDLAEDRFRGIFKVKYEGDAYLQLRTKVQANPLNTFLSTKPDFASPGPLAAGSGLTIPLQITLSDIRLSGFVILVFNKQKGITLVFRNDPLESLKVSSTFDTIPFVRDYLQKTIEEQLRVLFMEDLPAIIHRLSLRVFNSELDDNENQPSRSDEQETAALPESSPAGVVQQETGSGELDIWSLSPFESSVEMYTAFSQHNLLKLAALNESQRTLSLFTPSIQDTVVRAWASAHERKEHRDDFAMSGHKPTSLSRIQSQLSMSQSGWSSNASQTSDAVSQSTRPGTMSHASSSTTYNLGMGRSRPHGARKKKHRVVDLRRNKDVASEGVSDTVSVSSGYTESASHSGSISAAGSTDPTSPLVRSTLSSSLASKHGKGEERDGEVHTPYTSPKKKVGFQQGRRNSDHVVTLSAEISGSAEAHSNPHLAASRHRHMEMPAEDIDATPRASTFLPPRGSHVSHEQESKRSKRDHLPRMRTFPEKAPTERSRGNLPRSASELSISDLAPAFNMQAGSSGGILEQAWMMKMATEIAKRVAEEKDKQSRSSSFSKWDEEEHLQGEAPPPAYGS